MSPQETRGAPQEIPGMATLLAATPQSDAQAPPKFLSPQFERMPAELTPLRNWVLWVPIWNESKWTKRPVQPSGYGASTTNPQHWHSFDDVKRAYELAVERGYFELQRRDKPPQRVAIGGVGFVFDGQPDEKGFVVAGVDFDKVIFNDRTSLSRKNASSASGHTPSRACREPDCM
jgi:primase-polymerase (primpol)-like protein